MQGTQKWIFCFPPHCFASFTHKSNLKRTHNQQDYHQESHSIAKQISFMYLHYMSCAAPLSVLIFSRENEKITYFMNAYEGVNQEYIVEEYKNPRNHRSITVICLHYQWLWPSWVLSHVGKHGPSGWKRLNPQIPMILAKDECQYDGKQRTWKRGKVRNLSTALARSKLKVNAIAPNRLAFFSWISFQIMLGRIYFFICYLFFNIRRNNKVEWKLFLFR